MVSVIIVACLLLILVSTTLAFSAACISIVWHLYKIASLD